ncbi:MAG: branched-chain amino acid ABC transporter permease [Candidatus Elarobacter sp.]
MNARRVLPFAVLAAIVVTVPFLHDGYITATMVVIGENAIAALGLSFLVGTAGEVSLAQAAFFGLGAYAAAAASRHGLDPWLAIVFAACVVGAVAAVVGWPTLRLRGHYLTLATLGLGIIAKVVFDEATGLTGGPSGFGDYGTLHWFAHPLAGDVASYVVAWITVAVGAGAIVALRASSRGRALRAIAGSEAAAAAMGVHVRARKLEAFVLSAVFASVAGSLYAFYVGYISPTSFTFEQSVFFLVMVVLGGARSSLGPIVGAALYTLIAALLTQAAGAVFPSSAQSAAAALQVIAFGLILVLVMRFMPLGIAGTLAAWRMRG